MTSVIQEQSNRELVREIYAALLSGDNTVFAGAVHEDFEAHVAPAMPWGGVYDAEAILSDVMPRLATAIDVSSLRLTSISADGDDVVALLTGRSVSGNALWIAEDWTFRDGKIGQLRVFYFDARAVDPSPTVTAS